MRWAEGHSNNVRRMFMRLMLNPKLTISEKIEFAYLTPYYLQAFFFLVGTISWITSEAIFRVKLPFWTSLWGWSLVLTNLLSLPLMNAVGLFLEEAEEKDYAGIISFIGLSYILVPFQAYASLKGFIRREEGPWFRTPKTGKITDVFARGKFYRFIAGIFPGRRTKPTTAPATTQSNKTMDKIFSPYLAISSANSTFSSFKIKSKTTRKARRVGKVLMSFLLLISTTLIYLSPFIPVTSPPEAQAKGFGAILSAESTEEGSINSEEWVEEIDKNVEKDFSTSDSKDKSVKQILEGVIPFNDNSTTDNVSDYEKVQDQESKENHEEINEKPKQTINLENYTLTLTPSDTNTGTNTFLVSSNPEFEIVSEVREYKFFQLVFKTVKKVFTGSPDPEYIKAEITNSKDEVVFSKDLNLASLKSSFKKGNVVPVNLSSGLLKPGAYSIRLENPKDNQSITQDFSWGVLAINTNKSIYLSSSTSSEASDELNEMESLTEESPSSETPETAKLSMAVLDEFGDMVCNAKVDLEIKAPDGDVKVLSTDDETIIVNPECNIKAFTLKADYEAAYEVRGAGVYTMTLSATTDNGTYTIKDTFEARNSLDFEVERITATRIYPRIKYPVTINIKANEDFQGEVKEILPASFDVLSQQIEGNEIEVNTQKIQPNNQSNDSNTGSTNTNQESVRTVTWKADFKKGNTYQISYEYDAPDTSPEFYLLGPLELVSSGGLSVFKEARRWQVAVDSPRSYTEKQESWTPGSTGWTAMDLSGSPYNVASDAVVEIAMGNLDRNDPVTVGVREYTSVLDRYFTIDEAEGFGEDYLVMHVQADSSSRIYQYTSVAADVKFYLLGFWDYGTYVEMKEAMAAGTADTWEDENLSGAPYNVPANAPVEVVMTNSDSSNAYEVGVEENGSGLAQ
jgi:hypothetical protein